MTTIRLLTFNTLFRGRARERLRALGAVLERSDYDLVCLQELMSPRNLAALRAVAHSYGYAARARAYPLVRGGLVTLSRTPPQRQHFTPFRPARPLRSEWIMLKGALATEYRVAGQRLVVVNTHLSSNRDDDWSPGNRYTQVQARELARLEELVRATDPSALLVVAGDFNVPRDSSTYQRFTAATGLRDLLAGDREPTYRPTRRWPNPPALDQVLLRAPAGVRVDGTARLVLREAVALADGTEAYLSDHYAIEAVLRIEPAAARRR
ncbi:endonuclease/exonuclease/phosphatase family protein [Kitasatospora viridis]|uniref:Endonuclease/exonuclease/phosphatase family protein n=1 Tax=Kitasatospora viridis TaxID=281105 RepID=A0A561S9T9_9ACTN|nr:endonuclease/exonuclease/phosphatase family protein [Kitasatospora viridis]TWF71575.1 endonuclease/exonuclease/phosphatase family protein [Kitasatospora viridis]